VHEALQFAQNLADKPAAESWSLRGLRDEFALRRDARLIRSSGLFDVEYYNAANPDVAKSGVDPILHFLRYGMREGRKPSASFDPQNYLDDFPEAAEQGVNPLVHYIHSRAK
jgi:hypothetical protein